RTNSWGVALRDGLALLSVQNLAKYSLIACVCGAPPLGAVAFDSSAFTLSSGFLGKSSLVGASWVRPRSGTATSKPATRSKPTAPPRFQPLVDTLNMVPNSLGADEGEAGCAGAGWTSTGAYPS